MEPGINIFKWTRKGDISISAQWNYSSQWNNTLWM